jgi:hypothetical protein
MNLTSLRLMLMLSVLCSAELSYTVVPLVLAPTGQFVCLASFISSDLLLTAQQCVAHTNQSNLFALVARQFNVTHLQQLSERVHDHGWTAFEHRNTTADHDSLPVALRLDPQPTLSAVSTELALFQVHPSASLSARIKPACLHSLPIKPSRSHLLYWDSDQTWSDRALLHTQNVRIVSTLRCASHFPSFNLTFTSSPSLRALRCVFARRPDNVCMSQPGSPLLASGAATLRPRLLGLSLFAGTCSRQSPLLLSSITRRLHSSSLSRFFC